MSFSKSALQTYSKTMKYLCKQMYINQCKSLKGVKVNSKVLVKFSAKYSKTKTKRLITFT